MYYPSGFIVVTAFLVIWCFVRFNVKKRFSKDKKCKSSKYFTNPVDLKVQIHIIIFTALLSTNSFHSFDKVVERLGKAYTEKVNSIISFKEAALEGLNDPVIIYKQFKTSNHYRRLPLIS